MAIGSLGEAAKLAAPALRRAAQSPHELLRKAADEALLLVVP